MELTRRLSGKTAVVTAAGQGIGRAIAERFVSEGAEVFASDLSDSLLKDLRGARTATLDATDLQAVAAYFRQFTRIDALVHAVGYVHQGNIEECTPEDWRRSRTVTLDSAYLVLRSAVPLMKVHGGSITTIGSVASSIKGFPKRAAYGAAKAGVIGLTKAIAADYVKFGLRCNTICPGTVESPSLRDRIRELAQELGSEEEAQRFFIDRQPSGRFGTPNEIAGLCVLLASDEGSFITGQAINVDGGITI